jgi:anti-sigma B factor antagonist
MQFEKEQKNNVNIIRLKVQRLDSTTAPNLKAEFLLMLEQNQFDILVDLAMVDYADSSGLGAILFGIRQLDAAGGQVKLVNLRPRVLSLIKIAKLDDVIEAYDNEDEAIASFEE